MKKYTYSYGEYKGKDCYVVYPDDRTPNEDTIVKTFTSQREARYFVEDLNEQQKRKAAMKAVIPTVILLIVLFLFTVALTYVPVGKQAMVKNKVTGETTLIEKPGMSFVTPFVDSVHKVSVAQRSYDYKDTANTKDNIQVTYNSTITGKIDDVSKYYGKRYNLSDENIQQLVNSELTKSLDRVSNKYEYNYIKANVASVGEEITANVNKTLSSYGLEITSVSIKGFDAPESVEKAIQAKIAKQQQAESTKYDVEKATNEAKAQKIKQDSVSDEQQQMDLCDKAIAKGDSQSPACNFSAKTYVTTK